MVNVRKTYAQTQKKMDAFFFSIGETLGYLPTKRQIQQHDKDWPLNQFIDTLSECVDGDE